MEHLRVILSGLIALVLLTACSSQWTRLDGSPVDQTSLEQAQQACRVDEKLARLEQIDDRRAEQLAQAKDNAGKMLARENYDLEVQQINAELDSCMRGQGLKRGG